VFVLSVLAALALAAVATGAVRRARSQRADIYPELPRPLSTTPGRHKLVK
jgi:hypothetical protein